MRFLYLSLVLLSLSCPLLAGVEEDWNVLVELNKGPEGKPKTRAEALALARSHFAKHQRAITLFLARYPDDPRCFDAKLLQATILAASGKMEGDQRPIDEAMRQLVALEQEPSLTKTQKADVSFRRIVLFMQSAKNTQSENQIVDATQNFADAFPGDPRGPRLLVEAATLLDEQPSKKADLLARARSETAEKDLLLRIEDDEKRLSLLGKPLNLQFRTTEGRLVNLSALRGKVVAVLFWSGESPHCLLWLQGFKRAVASLGGKDLVVVTVNMDTSMEAMREASIGWPTYFDGKGWQSAVARPLGINALPTLFVVDKRGILRAVNARDTYEGWIRKLVTEKG